MNTSTHTKTTQSAPLNGSFNANEMCYNLSFYAVAIDKLLVVNGKNTTLIGSPISPRYATIEQARLVKSMLLAEYPDCYIGSTTMYYESENDSNRLDLLSSIIFPVSGM